jgi:methylated-DNA-[protein]-cysteine S-methyltransferase
LTKFQYSLIKTLWGDFLALFTEKGLWSLEFPKRGGRQVKENAALVQVPPSAGRMSIVSIGSLTYQEQQWIAKLTDFLKNYFKGLRVSYTEPLDLSWANGFTLKVLQAALTIPYGKTLSYKELGSQIGLPKAYRAVGNALGKNKIPLIIPCHRVLTSSGSLGGYSSGLKWKKRLLKLEGIKLP